MQILFLSTDLNMFKTDVNGFAKGALLTHNFNVHFTTWQAKQ